MPVQSSMESLTAVASVNYPRGPESISSQLDDYLRSHAAILRHTETRGATLTSTASMSLGAATGAYVPVSGAASIAHLGTVDAGIERVLVFSGAAKLLHSANLILPGSATVQCAVGDCFTFRSDGAGAWRCITSSKADGREAFQASLNVRDYGAVGDGVTDDTAAFNALTAYIRTLLQENVVSTDDFFDVSATIPPGKYLVSSWDLTQLLGRAINITAHGASIIGSTADKVVVDALGSRWLRIRGLKVLGLATAVPLVGIQIGRVGDETCGNNSFYDVECIGYFSRAAFHNSGSETTQHFACTYQQRSETAGTYAFIGDGMTNFLPVSDYATVTRVEGDAASFTNNSHYATQFRHQGGGDAVYLAKTDSWLFDQGCYFLSFNGAAVRLYATSTWRNANLTLNGLFESNQTDVPAGSGNTGIKYLVVLDGNATNTALERLTINTAGPHVATSVFYKPNAGTYRLSEVDLTITGLTNAAATWFSGTTAGLSIGGSIRTRQASKLNLGDLDKFNGYLYVDDATELASAPAAGSYVLNDEDNSAQQVRGTVEYDCTEATFTPTIRFETNGDLAVSYGTQSGRYYRIGKLVFVEIYITFTPTYTTATGEFRLLGIPSALENDSIYNGFTAASVNSAFVWPTGTTQVVPFLPILSEVLRFYSFGNNVASTLWTVDNVPSGQTHSLIVNGTFVTA